MTSSEILISRLGLALLASLLAFSWPGPAAAAGCLQSTTVTATGIGLAFRDESPAVADAIQDALDQAITQARGVFVTSSTELWESYRYDTSARVSDLDLDSGFSHELSSRFSGFVEGYEVTARRELGSGMMEVIAEVQVCLDERIAIGLPRSDARDAVLNALLDDVRAAGWHVIYDTPHPEAGSGELLDFTLETGVTYVAQGSVETSIDEAYGMKNATVALTVNLLDTRNLQLVHAFSIIHTGVGPTAGAAVRMAGERAGIDLAREWNRVFLHPSHRDYAEFIFEGVRRSGTRFSLADIASTISGVLHVVDNEFDSRLNEVRLVLEIAADACGIAREVPGYRRVRTELTSCRDGEARFAVWGD